MGFALDRFGVALNFPDLASLIFFLRACQRVTEIQSH